MKSYGEYCPIAMGAEAIGDRWTPLVLRELFVGSERFTEIHNGVPRMSRTLLTQRLRQLERMGMVARTDDGRYQLTPAGRDLEGVVWGMGEWAVTWMQGDPAKEHHDGAHLMWRVYQRLVADALPPKRTVIRFDFRNAVRGARVWLLLDPAGSSVCQRDEGFEVDLWVDADIATFMQVWAGRATWASAFADGSIVLHGPAPLVRDFPGWFALSPFARA
jgi:DNA-binding HxlR family transcriptional regulator